MYIYDKLNACFRKGPEIDLHLGKVRNCILCILRAWSLFFLIRIYVSLHLLFTLLKN